MWYESGSVTRIDSETGNARLGTAPERVFVLTYFSSL